ncbi:MAG: YceI family protein [Gammaproteobacteria bacterium]|nr:YceI family protein [Gammaproteobacteria bacterium]
MNAIKLFRRLLLAVLLLQAPAMLMAAEDDLCEAFLDGKVDASLLSTMLSAAENGHLYRIDQDSSRVGFCVDSQLSRVEGSFRDFRGGLALDSKDIDNGQAMIVIRTASVDTDAAFIKQLLKGDSFFDVDRNPEILFVSTGFEWISPTEAKLQGDITLRGVTRSVVFDVTLTDKSPANNAGAEDKILVKATTTLNRTDFGMTSLTSLVSNNVRLCMSVEATRYKS